MRDESSADDEKQPLVLPSSYIQSPPLSLTPLSTIQAIYHTPYPPQLSNIQQFISQFPSAVSGDGGCRLPSQRMRERHTHKQQQQKKSSTIAHKQSGKTNVSTLHHQQVNQQLKHPERPWQQTLLDAAFHRLCLPSFFVANNTTTTTLTTETIVPLLRAGAQQLPILTAQHEQQLLYEAGTYRLSDGRSITFPVCFMGRDCIANQYPKVAFTGQTRAFMMTAAMTPDEYTQLLQFNVKPKTIRPCVLCHRDSLIQYVLHLKSLGLASEITDPREIQSRFRWHTEQPGAEPVYQLWRNLVDTPGGYYKSVVREPQNGESLPLLDPLARISTYHMICCTNTLEYQPPRLYLNQHALMWRSTQQLLPTPVLPPQGEMYKDFPNGAGITSTN